MIAHQRRRRRGRRLLGLFLPVLVPVIAGIGIADRFIVDHSAHSSLPSDGGYRAPPVDQVSVRGHVVRVVDGDTIDVATPGHEMRVRLVGIDTPERGECGYDAATVTLRSLVHARPVDLTRGSTAGSDRYGRLLRFVEVDGVDVGAELLRHGDAVARYNSTDGYDRHPREDQYARLDAASPSRC